jgi:TonB-linked SusC/RagA family outer membrane protein
MKNKLLRQLAMMGKRTFYGLVLQLFFLNLLMAYTGNAQVNKVQSVKDFQLEISFSNESLVDVFRKIEEKSGYHFAYEADLLDRSFIFNSGYRKKHVLADILLDLSKETGLRFKQINKTIIVITKRQQHNFEPLEIVIDDITITGKVTSLDDGEGLPGVNVVVKGTSKGTVTDVSGFYTIDVSSVESVLSFSSVGYVSEEILVGNQTVIDLTLSPDLQSLEEIVVIGYGTQERKDLTGSVSTLDASEVRDMNIASPDQMLQGRLAGVNVKQASSAPGGLTSVRIRGSNSFLGSNEPLYVIDGIPIFNDAQELTTYGGPGTTGGDQRINPENPLVFLNPADIESINVLKDASATAIYGARGSNGVIIITTKRGKAGQSKLDVDFYQGWQDAINLPEMMSTTQLQDYYNQHQDNPASREYKAAMTGDYAFADSLPSTNWLEEMTRQGASITNLSVTASGGNDKLRYSTGGNYYQQDGVLQASDIKRFSLRVNLDADITDRISVGTSLIASRAVNNFAWVDGTANGIFGMGSVMAGMLFFPFHDVYDDNGQPFRNNAAPAQKIIRSPYPMNHPIGLLTEQTDLRKMNRMLGNFYGKFNITDNLYLKVSIGGDIEARDNSIYYTRLLTQGPRLIRQSSNKENFINENTLNYSYVTGDHSIDAVAGFSIQQNDALTFFSQDTSFPFDRLGADADNQGEIINTTSSFRSRWTMASYLGRVNYGFKGKYLFTASVRADGSSRFAEDNKWGVFPSGAFAWRMSDEAFMSQVDAINNLKLRASIGVTGNSEIGTNQSNLRLGNSRYSFGGAQVNTFFPSGPENSGLKWELTTQTDIGIDLDMFNSRLMFVFDVYWKTTSDLLVSVPLDPLTGFNSTILNIGGITNNGIDVSLTGNWINTDNFSWSTSANYSMYRNEVTEISPLEDEFIAAGAVERGEYRSYVKVGEPLGVFRGFRTDGLVTAEDVDNNIPSPTGTAVEGDIKFVDVSEDGIINNEDYTVIGNPHPDFTFGVSNNFRYKIFDLGIMISGSVGNDILNTTSFHAKDPRQLTTNKYAVLAKNSWTPENTNAKYPRAGSNLQGIFIANDLLAIEDGSYVKIQNVSLGVNLNRDIIKFAQNLRVYVSGQNLAVWTDYLGTSPEVNSGGQSTVNLGVDTGGYPMTRIFMLGLNLTF